MNDTPNFQNPMNPDPTRRLKKVKRPIKRIQPQSGNMPLQPSSQVNPYPHSASNQSANNVNTSASDDLSQDIMLPTISDAASVENQQNFSDNNIPHFINEEEMLYEQNPNAFATGNAFVAKKIAIAIGVAAFIVGALAAKLLFGEQKVVRDGLQGVVVNSEVPRGRARCGVAEKTQGCVLYIMNPQRQELSASDFYDLASQLTGRQRFIIETGNMRYSNRKIKPGEIAQFNIPPLQ